LGNVSILHQAAQRETALNFESDWGWIASRLAAALVAGAILGINRDLHRKPAGLRTLALVSVGSALVVVVTLLLSNHSADAASRVIQGLMTGVGFLGAGVIIHHERERRVEGLTTAASVWVASGLGAACGAGLGTVAILALVATMIILVMGGRVEEALERRFMKAEAEDSASVDP
jgi:putative Mg2+ transporter-C (MgtC) family protein